MWATVVFCLSVTACRGFFLCYWRAVAVATN
jgi:hypothetical protein